ncbi:hypothetical protein HY604_00065 [Candidatus Peregrinibacteria bacterium]|nr:hypothetical protein [Candidatus Peregrinibacteria bacterium]
MFITLTIDTHAIKKPIVRMQKNRFDASKGWRKEIHAKKRSLIQKFQGWKKSLKAPQYKVNGQISAF